MPENLKLALVGNVNSGKSSIINALLKKEVAEISAKGGKTTDKKEYKLDKEYIIKDRSFQLVIVDTPGLSEVGGKSRAELALKTAKKADAVLFVICGDMNDVEFGSLVNIMDFGKPTIVIFNQTDRYSAAQQKEIITALEDRVGLLVGLENILSVSASPMQKIVIRNENGEDVIVERKGIPDVESLKSRIIKLANKEGKNIKAITNFVEQFERDVKKHSKYLNRLNAESDAVSLDYAIKTAVVVAVNPVAFLDVAGGAAGIGLLIKKLAYIYGMHLSKDESVKLSKELWRESKGLSVFSLVAISAGSAMKMIPFIGWLAGGATQATATGVLVYIIGRTVSVYFANGKRWVTIQRKNCIHMHFSLDRVLCVFL